MMVTSGEGSEGCGSCSDDEEEVVGNRDQEDVQAGGSELDDHWDVDDESWVIDIESERTKFLEILIAFICSESE